MTSVHQTVLLHPIPIPMKTNLSRMFLAGQRAKTGLPWFKSLHGFNFGTHQHPGKDPVAPLRVWNENALQAGKTVSMQVEAPSDVLILPLVGGLRFKTVYQESWVENGQMLAASLSPGTSYEILNPYEEDWISYLEIGVEKENPATSPSVSIHPVNTHQTNTLHPLFTSGQANAFFGIYNGQEEDLFLTSHDLFVFVIEGAFEVDYKLLEARDAVAISRPGEIEFEALSDHAMLLIFELKPEFTA